MISQTDAAKLLAGLCAARKLPRDYAADPTVAAYWHEQINRATPAATSRELAAVRDEISTGHDGFVDLALIVTALRRVVAARGDSAIPHAPGQLTPAQAREWRRVYASTLKGRGGTREKALAAANELAAFTAGLPAGSNPDRLPAGSREPHTPLPEASGGG